MNVSVICTVRNEAKSISALIDTLLGGERAPDEIVIVDGGSSDDTTRIIESYAKKNPSIRLITKGGVNISQGRNIAIQNAKYDIIASIDGGCIADKKWLKKLIEPFEKDPTVDYSVGFYLPGPRSKFEEVVGDLLFPRLENVDHEKMAPSVKSMAFKKKCWETVGGFPEWLYSGEDNLFVTKFREKSYKDVFIPDAVVYWRPRSNLKGVYKQYFIYSKGAAEANIVNTTFNPYGKSIFSYFIPHLIKYMLTLIRRMALIHLLYIPFILAAVFFGKVSGLIAGMSSSKQQTRGIER
ncbi:MAG: glycosyltransferase [Dehalobacter sp.]|nr:glycosyltransferase [Dehalobacter sp.]